MPPVPRKLSVMSCQPVGCPLRGVRLSLHCRRFGVKIRPCHLGLENVELIQGALVEQPSKRGRVCYPPFLCLTASLPLLNSHFVRPNPLSDSLSMMAF